MLNICSARASARILILTIITLGVNLGANAEMYKWKDKKGRIHYSDTPPGSGAVRVIKARPGGGSKTMAQPADPAKTYIDQEAEFRKRRVEADEAEAKKKQEVAKAEARKHECNEARGHLRALEEGGRLVKYDDKGERVFLDDKARESDMAKTKKYLADNCK